MRNTRARRGLAAGQRRKLVWADSQGVVSPLGQVPAGLNVDLMAGYRAAGGSTQGVTIIRTHLALACTYASSALIAHNEGYTAGLIIDDSTATVATLNVSNRYDDWMLYRTFRAMEEGKVIQNSVPAAWGQSNVIDLKAKRKMQELNQTYWLCLASVNNTTVQSASWHARVLLALP